MLTHHSTGIGKDPGVAAPESAGDRRAALYLCSVDDSRKHPPALIDCALPAPSLRRRASAAIACGTLSNVSGMGSSKSSSRTRATP